MQSQWPAEIRLFVSSSLTSPSPNYTAQELLERGDLSGLCGGIIHLY